MHVFHESNVVQLGVGHQARGRDVIRSLIDMDTAIGLDLVRDRVPILFIGLQFGAVLRDQFHMAVGLRGVGFGVDYGLIRRQGRD